MTRPTRLFLTLLFLLASATWSQAALIVHEWGTITTRHNPDGTPQGGLNRIDPSAVLPPFVHRFEPEQTKAHPDQAFGKSSETPGRPDITMRLETPVIYFHPSRAARPEPFDVSVSFRGGILNEFYPNAEASVSIDKERIDSKMQAGLLQWDGTVLDNFVQGSLSWKGLQFSSFVTCPETDQIAWLAPRRVKSEKVMVAGEGDADPERGPVAAVVLPRRRASRCTGSDADLRSWRGRQRAKTTSLAGETVDDAEAPVAGGHPPEWGRCVLGTAGPCHRQSQCLQGNRAAARVCGE
jgi:hypothetical protein